MTSTDRHHAFWILQEIFVYILHRGSVNREALRLIVEAQRKVFAS